MAVRIIDIEDEFNWQKFRNTGIGASEVSTLMGLNPFKSALQLFHEKLGFKNYSYINLLMMAGKVTEQLTSDIFECYNGGTVNETALNIQNGKKFRTCKKLPHLSYIQNDSWKNIFVSPDREFSTPTIDSAALEIKETNSQYLSGYKDKFIPSHKVQLSTQMAVWEKDYGCLAYLIDRGRDYREVFFKRDGIIWHDQYTGKTTTEDDLKTIISDFWQSVVLARDATHRKMQAELDFNMLAAGEYQSIIDQLEPPPDTLLAYENFLKEGFYSLDRPKIERQGTEEDEKAAELFLKTKEVMKDAEAQHQQQRNNILNLCKTGHKILLPGKGRYIEVASTKVGTLIKVKN